MFVCKAALLTAMSWMRVDRSMTCSLAERSSTPSRWSLSFILFRVFIMSSFSCVLVSHSRSFFSSFAISSTWSKGGQGSERLFTLGWDKQYVMHVLNEVSLITLTFPELLCLVPPLFHLILIDQPVKQADRNKHHHKNTLAVLHETIQGQLQSSQAGKLWGNVMIKLITDVNSWLPICEGLRWIASIDWGCCSLLS